MFLKFNNIVSTKQRLVCNLKWIKWQVYSNNFKWWCKCNLCKEYLECKLRCKIKWCLSWCLELCPIWSLAWCLPLAVENISLLKLVSLIIFKESNILLKKWLKQRSNSLVFLILEIICRSSQNWTKKNKDLILEKYCSLWFRK